MFETWSTTERPELSWEQFHAELSETFLDLTKGEILTVRVPRDPPREPPRPNILVRFYWWLTSGGPRDIDPLLQFFRLDDTLYCECGGPVESGGYVRLSTEQQDQIIALGWAQAEGKDRGRWGYPNYRGYFPHEENAVGRPAPAHVKGEYHELVDGSGAARLAIATLRGPLGVSMPSALVVSRGG